MGKREGRQKREKDNGGHHESNTRTRRKTGRLEGRQIKRCQ